MKVGVVYERDNNNEGFSYYRFIENKFSYDKELEDDVLSDDDKFEIEEVFFNESEKTYI